MNKKFAFAVNNSNSFESTHFGDADKYMIYELVGDDFKFISEHINEFKTMDEESQHGSRKKGNTIISYLKDIGVKILVSKQFGKNVKMINQHFIPVVVYEDSVDVAIPILLDNTVLLDKELNNFESTYNLYAIKDEKLIARKKLKV